MVKPLHPSCFSLQLTADTGNYSYLCAEGWISCSESRIGRQTKQIRQTRRRGQPFEVGRCVCCFARTDRVGVDWGGLGEQAVAGRDKLQDN